MRRVCNEINWATFLRKGYICLIHLTFMQNLYTVLVRSNQISIVLINLLFINYFELTLKYISLLA